MTARRAGAAGARAGLAYFLLVFLIAFIFGTIRTLAVAPALGDVKAVLIELPFLLLVSWFGCKWIVFKLAVPKRVIPRVVMGLTAFVVLICAEAVLAIILMKLSLSQHFALYLEPANQVGLVGQMAFALFPLVQLRSDNPQIGEAGQR